MKKPLKLALYLVLTVVILAAVWQMADYPRFTAEGALHRIESANMAPKSELIALRFFDGVYSRSIKYQRYMAMGVTDTHLHMSEVRKGAFLWHRNGRSYHPLVSLPLEDGPMAGLVPDDWPFTFYFFLYNAHPATRWAATLTAGPHTLTAEGAVDAGAVTFFDFPELRSSHRSVRDSLQARSYDLLHIGYLYDQFDCLDVTLEVVLFDEHNTEIGRAIREYPAK